MALKSAQNGSRRPFVSGWASMTRPDGETNIEALSQATQTTVGELWAALAILTKWMLKPKNAERLQEVALPPPHGVGFLETLWSVVENPRGPSME